MESLPQWICAYAHMAPYILFGLLLLAGLNIPISEDIILLASGAIASTCVKEHTYYLYSWVFLGCWISAWEAYWAGRLLGPKVYTIRPINRYITPKRIAKLHVYYEKFGIFTFIVGRFIPGGVRNALFMTAGMGKMPFLLFLMRDFIACVISSATIFTVGYKFGKHYGEIVQWFKRYEEILLGIILIAITGVGFLLWRSNRDKCNINPFL